MRVVPRASAAAISAFSVPVTLASSRWISAPRSPPGARSRYSRPTSTSAPSAANAIRWVSTRRRPITSPPGGGTSAAPKRASSGPASRIDARMRVAQLRVELGAGDVGGPHAHRVAGRPLDLDAERDDQLEHLLDVPDARHVLERDRIGGQQARLPGSAARRSCCRRGGRCPRAAAPPSIRNASTVPSRVAVAISTRVAPFAADAAGPACWVVSCRPWPTTSCTTATPPGQLLTEWTQSEALLRHALAVEAAVRAYARKRGEDEEAWGNVALLHDFDYERHPTLDQHPAGRRARAARARLSGVVRPRHALARRPHRRHPRDAARAHALRLRRAVRVRPRLRPGAPGRARHAGAASRCARS